MKNPVTTSLAIVVFFGVLARAVTLYIAGQPPDWTEISAGVAALLGALGLYKAIDPGNAPPAK